MFQGRMQITLNVTWVLILDYIKIASPSLFSILFRSFLYTQIFRHMNYSLGYFDFIGDNKFRFKSSNQYINFFFFIKLLYQFIHRDQRFFTL